MRIWVVGGAASGKSAFAESCLSALAAEQKLYIATMRPMDGECVSRIEKHRIQRQGKGFSTLECYRADALRGVPENAGVLLECVTNLLSNEMYEQGGAGENAAAHICQEMLHMGARTAHTVIVSGNVFADGVDYAPQTQQYIRLLGEISQRMAAEFDCVVEVVCGIPITHKGEGLLR